MARVFEWLGAVTAVAGCAAEPADEPQWRSVEVDAIADVTFVAASGSDETVVAVGQAADRAVVVTVDGDEWTVVRDEIGDPPSAVWMARPDDAWVVFGGQLERWRGGAWETVALSSVRTVWGAAADDVFAIVARPDELPATWLMHFDGGAWSRIVGLEDVQPGGIGPGLVLRAGCDEWVMGGEDPPAQFTAIFRRSGTGWERVVLPAPTTGRMDDLACRGSEVWFKGEYWTSNTQKSGAVINLWQDERWVTIDQPIPDGILQLTDIAAAAGGAWLIGADNSPSTGRSRPEIWRYDGNNVTTTLDRELDLPTLTLAESEAAPLLRAVWTTAGGRTLVFGDDGIVLESKPR